MCGITGWIDWQRDLNQQREVLREMQETLVHRGPDEKGKWITETAGLMHRRLIVIDPDGGKQPMVKRKSSNQYIIVYNGELYNTQSLRKKLQQVGYSFQGHSDTEVVLTSYLEWGVDCVQQLNGIFAFGIWDVKREQLYLARDRLGVKPLFYSQLNNGLIFGSELKSLLEHPEIEPEIGREGLAEVLAVGPGRTPGHGIFKGINELKPGHYLIYDRQGIRTKQYWQLESRPHTDDLETTIERVRELFVDTVNRQLVSDVPLCTLLSGGLDSSAITAVASENMAEQLHTYSVDYEGNEEHFEANDFQPDSDQQWIQQMSEFANTNHHNITLSTKNLVDHLRTGVLARDLPGMADIDISLYLFCREIAEEFTVAVSGECADEIFGGYPWFHRQEALQADTFPWARRLDSRLQVVNQEVVEQISPREYLNNRYQEALAEVPTLADEDVESQQMRKMTYLTLTRWMPILLERKDRMSMHTNLEVRVPFCDHRLVEYAWNIPWDWKNYNGRRKGVLRAALKGILPEAIRTRPKNPYPKTFNPNYFTAVKNWLKKIIADPKAPLTDLIDKRQIKKLTQADQDFTIPWFGQLMRLPQLFAYLIQLNIWLEEYDVQIKC